eukprot:TRINITY_DN3246_c0_g1_i4.p1 TRINITY_DN3246_c0_g1~~TRINITY_DN3246_c0_g1_i4.p1  ORF type:complete len:114 (-),score=2.21 TRINITY_DN3246_c0_g1_i4:21-362(-)
MCIRDRCNKNESLSSIDLGLFNDYALMLSDYSKKRDCSTIMDLFNKIISNQSIEDIAWVLENMNLITQVAMNNRKISDGEVKFLSKPFIMLSLIHICRCRRIERCRSRWSPYH